MEELPEEVRSFLTQHPGLQPIPGNKVRFTLTGHELPGRLPDLQRFTAGRKYQRLDGASSYSAPHIVPSTKNGQQLFCKLTLRHIGRRPQDVQKHTAGRRYQSALRKYEECQRLGKEFVPACLQNKQRRPREERGANRKDDVWKPDDSQSEESDSADSMSDLYPAHIFTRKEAAGEENGGSHSHSQEEMEVEESCSNHQGKRAQRQAGPSHNKLKSQPRKRQKLSRH